jgi:hypothetical protein
MEASESTSSEKTSCDANTMAKQAAQAFMIAGRNRCHSAYDQGYPSYYNSNTNLNSANNIEQVSLNGWLRTAMVKSTTSSSLKDSSSSIDAGSSDKRRSLESLRTTPPLRRSIEDSSSHDESHSVIKELKAQHIKLLQELSQMQDEIKLLKKQIHTCMSRCKSEKSEELSSSVTFAP